MTTKTSFFTCRHGVGMHPLHVTQWGDSLTPTPVFCVHALTRRGEDFTKLAESLQPRTVVAPDMVGRGQSPWLLDSSLYSYVHYINDCIQLLNHLGLMPVDWVNWSSAWLSAESLVGNES